MSPWCIDYAPSTVGVGRHSPCPPVHSPRSTRLADMVGTVCRPSQDAVIVNSNDYTCGINTRHTAETFLQKISEINVQGSLLP